MPNEAGPRKKQPKHDMKNRRRRQCMKRDISADTAKYASTPSGISVIAHVFKVEFHFCLAVSASGRIRPISNDTMLSK